MGTSEHGITLEGRQQNIYELDLEEMRRVIFDSGLKQKIIAEKAGLSEVKLCMILQGQRRCEVREYAGICEVLGVELGKFLKTKNC